jgi:asparagine synthase (glutamine-hydrolysing)
MCGICGFTWEDKSLVRRMASTIEHRGPDDYGFYAATGISLGHRRLSIIDLSRKGRQPMSNEDGSVWIVYNGELYNYLAIRGLLEKKGHKFRSNTDTEVIIHAYEEFGEQCLQRFNGMFAFAIWDSNKKSLFLARDRMGEKPLYYFHDKARFIFGSEIKAILEDKSIKRGVDIFALHDYLTFRCVSLPNTMFKGIRRLLPAHCLWFKNGIVTVRRYWSPLYRIEDRPEQFFVARLRSLLSDAVKIRLMSDVPLGAYLSGGIDSGTIVALMSKASDHPVKTFSVGFGEEHDELEQARFIAERLQTEHREVIVKADAVRLLPKIVWHLDEPMSDPTCIPVKLLSERIKRRATVVLTGDGGDEQFAGYEQYKFMLLHKRYANLLPVTIRRYSTSLANMAPKSLLNSVFPYARALGHEGIRRFRDFVSTNNSAQMYLDLVAIFTEHEKHGLYSGSVAEQLRSVDYVSEFNSQYFSGRGNYLQQVMTLDIDKILSENMLMKADKMTMAHAVESRVPFLDHRISELVATIPASLKIRGTTDKYILRKAMKGIVPAQTVKRKKSRFFVPIDKWFEGELMELAKQLLERKRVEKEGFFNHRYISRIFSDFGASPLFYSRQLWSLICFEMWHQQFIEN